jgi:hypothetical protein
MKPGKAGHFALSLGDEARSDPAAKSRRYDFDGGLR